MPRTPAQSYIEFINGLSPEEITIDPAHIAADAYIRGASDAWATSRLIFSGE
jgi:hypothetical protein